MAGLLDFLSTPEGQGLLAGAFGGMAGARRGQPINSIGRAGMSGLLGYGNALEQQGQTADKAFKGLQQQRQQQDWAKSDKIADLAGQFFQPGTSGLGATDQVNAALPAEFQIGAQPALPGNTPAKFDTAGYGNALMGLDPVKGLAYQQSLAKDSGVDKIKPDNYTPASLARFAGSRNFGDLVPRDKLEFVEGVGVNPYDPANANRAIPNANKPFQMGADGQPVPNMAFQRYELGKASAGAARSNVNNTVSVAGPENKYNADVGAGLAKDGLSLVDAAKAAAGTIANARLIRGALDSGAITGTGAPTRLAMQKALETAGLVGKGQAASTEQLISGLANLTLGSISTAGLGTGQGFTNKDLEFLSSAKSGTIENTPANLRRAADLSERVATATHQKGKAVLGRWKADPALRAVSQDTVLDDIAPAPAATPKATMRYENGKLVKVQ